MPREYRRLIMNQQPLAPLLMSSRMEVVTEPVPPPTVNRRRMNAQRRPRFMVRADESDSPRRWGAIAYGLGMLPHVIDDSRQVVQGTFTVDDPRGSRPPRTLTNAEIQREPVW